MTRKHFVALAAELKAIADPEVRVVAAMAIIRAIKKTQTCRHNCFDEQRFLKAANVSNDF